MQRAVGAAVLIGMICLGGMLSSWTIGVRLLAPDSLAIAFPDSAENSTRAVTARAQSARVSTAPPPSFLADPLVFLSRAPADSLDLLPGIGPVLAGRIVEHRRDSGGFSSWTQVLAIKGIGPRMIARWQALATRQ